MIRAAFPALLLILAGCGQGEGPANEAVPAAAPAEHQDVAAAKDLVRERLGAGQSGLRFGEASRFMGEGVPIVCGAYEHQGARQRYIVVGGAEVFIEPQMETGEMDRAFAEFCSGEVSEAPATAPAAAGNAQ